MKNGYGKIFVILFAFICVMFSSCGNTAATPAAATDVTAPTATDEEAGNDVTTPSSRKVGEDIPVTRAQAAKMLSLAFNDKMTVETMEREITFIDTSADKWYDRYINAAFLSGLMSGEGDMFYPEESLTLIQAQYLLDNIDESNTIKMVVTDENRDMPVSFAFWTELFLQALDNLGGKEQFGVAAVQIIPLATPGTNPSLKEFNMVTAAGASTYAGLDMEGYVDKAVTVLKKDGEILAVLTIDDDSPLIENAYLVSKNGDSITVFSGGAERTYAFDTNALPDGKICDIRVLEGTALSVEVFTETLTGTVKRVTAGYTELLEYGNVNNVEFMKIYGVSDNGPTWKSLGGIIVGSDIAEFVVSDGVIRAAILTKTAEPKNIRVCISTTDYKGYVHDGVKVTCSTAFTVRAGLQTYKFNAKDTFSVSASENANLYGAPRIYITPDEPGGKLQILSISRAWPDGEKPWYRGVIEIAKELSGGFTIVNELPFEEYLYAVVPSEMPTGHGLEAAKVQAVTARSYAYNQYFVNAYHRYGANVDDSVMCQVYNNIPENTTSVSACNETRGECLSYNGSVISANFFSTSAGVTANSGEVWANGSTRIFPTSTSGYLKSKKQYVGGDYGDLRLEENAYAFFKDTSVNSYDAGFSWFRWNVEMTAEEITASINSNIKARYNANPMLIKTLQPNGIFRSRPIETIGSLVDIEVMSRGEGGNIMSVKLTGTEATVMVYTEYNIRMLLRPTRYISGGRDIVTNLATGSTVKNYSLMPSAFFVFDKSRNALGVLEGVTFYGGGNGHGVGMSQNGVKGLIDAGYGFEEILKHYYNGTEIVVKW